MPVFGKLPGFKSVNADSGDQTKMPEFPPDCRCCHCATSSKLVYTLVERATPVGLPVQCTRPSFHVHVSFAQFTFTKSDPPSCRQPSPAPSMNALGSVADSSG